LTAPVLEFKRTPLNALHRHLGGRMVDFGGWDMPVQYPAGTVEEHLRTRMHAGLFDVSHMGEIDVRGPDAIAFVNYLASNDASKLIDGQAQYSALTTPEGTVVDDLLVYRFAPDHLLLVVNAGTTNKDWNWITSHRKNESIELHNVSADYCQLAVQGPDALAILQRLTDLRLSEVQYYHFTEGNVDGVPAIVSRTGYTGEDGFEVYAAADKAEQLWNKILDAGNFGSDEGVIPCGLAARNTLRLEAALALCAGESVVFVIGGQQLFAESLPIAAGLVLTEIYRNYEGDTWFPQYDRSRWREAQRERHTAADGTKLDFVLYEPTA